MYYLIISVYVLVCLLLSLVILLQQGRGGDIASAFGGGGSSQTAFGARSGATVLTKATSIAAALFMILALVLSIIGQRGAGSVVSGTPAPPAAAAPLTAPATAPAAPVQAPAEAPAAPAQ